MPRVCVAADRAFTTINRTACSFAAKPMPLRPVRHPIAVVADRGVQVHRATTTKIIRALPALDIYKDG